MTADDLANILTVWAMREKATSSNTIDWDGLVKQIQTFREWDGITLVSEEYEEDDQ